MSVLREEVDRRQKQLTDHLYKMAIDCMDNDSLTRVAMNLDSLYTGGFRHKYAGFFSVVTEIAKDDNNTTSNICLII